MAFSDDILQRKGDFQLSGDLISISNLPFVQMIMNNVIVIRCEYLFDCHRLWYSAISPMFDITSESSRPPLYEFSLNKSGILVCEELLAIG